MTIKIILRLAQVSDSQNLYKLNKECLPIYYDSGTFNSFIKDKNYIVCLAEINNTIAGYYVANINYNGTNYVHIMSIGVSNKYRKLGIGTHLIEKLCKIIKDKKLKCDGISLYVHVENDTAISFYKKNNFEINKVLNSYYSGSVNAKKSTDAYFMIKKLC